ncbi:MAG: hypothetical protein WDA02_11215 [Saccharofermentanales bacterium]
MIINFKDFILEKNNNIIIDVNPIDNIFINNLINNLSFIYKKRSDRYIRPKKITGNLDNNYFLKIQLTNKDIIDVEYINNTIKIKINNNLDYYMGDVNKTDIINIVYNRYTNFIKNNGFVIIKKNENI